MIRRRFVTGAIALATATVIAANGTANAQEIGTPEKIGNVPSSSDAFMQGVHGLSSNDPIERESAPNKFYLSVLVAYLSPFTLPHFPSSRTLTKSICS